MTFRARLLVGFGAVVLVPLIIFGLRVRTVMADRLTAAYQQRVTSLVAVIQADLDQQSAGVATRLAALKDAVASDNRFRAAVLQGGDRSYLLDYAGNAMRLAGLAMLQIQDDEGRIVSSGHFRNEYDQLEPDLPRLLAAAGGTALVRARTPEAPFLALARLDSLRLGGRRFTLVGGIGVDSSFLARLTPDSELTIAVTVPPDSATWADPATQVVSTLTRPFVAEGDSARLLPARIVVTHSLASLTARRRAFVSGRCRRDRRDRVASRRMALDAHQSPSHCPCREDRGGRCGPSRRGVRKRSRGRDRNPDAAPRGDDGTVAGGRSTLAGGRAPARGR